MPLAHIESKTHLKRIQAYIDRMPSLSTTVTKVLETCNSPHASPNDLKRVISLDPVLTGQVLKLINSAYYSLPHQITSLTRAIIMLGLNTVKNLALSFAILETMSSKGAFQAISMNDFWAHSLCVGVTARCLSAVKRISLSEREDYFVAGLLHDLGKIPLNKKFPNEYRCVLDITERDQEPLLQSENAVLGIDHCLVGKMIAEKWQLGLTLIEALACHHSPHEASAANRSFVSLVAVANAFANLLKVGSSGDCNGHRSITAAMLEQNGLDWSALDELRETVLAEIERSKIFLEISRRSRPYENKILGG